VYYYRERYTWEDNEMRTNIIIDDALMDEALKLSDFKTKKETVEEALRLFVSIKNQSSIRSYKGKLHWEGDLEKMRTC
jgi:Arc/MetJ family transcription regulator